MEIHGYGPSSGRTAFAIGSKAGEGGGRFGKRAFDVVVSAGLLILSIPLMALIGIALAIEHRGPILFAQDRIGCNLRQFRLLKFRTLVAHSEGGSLSRVLSRHDSRLTALGRFLRETGLDELPQLINVMGGTMSLVGPRPLVAEEAFACLESCPERFSVPPGITGLAQVRGRNRVPLTKRLQDDSEYVAHQSIWLDIGILLRTLSVPFSPGNAYPRNATSRAPVRGAR